MQRSLSGRERSRWILFSLASCVMMIAYLTSPVYASNVWSGTYANVGWDMSGFLDRIMDIYNLIKAICAPLAVCSIAGAGFEVLFGNEQEQAKGMARIKYTLMAVAAIFLLPAAINIGYDLAKNFMWDPNNPDYIP